MKAISITVAAILLLLPHTNARLHHHPVPLHNRRHDHLHHLDDAARRLPQQDGQPPSLSLAQPAAHFLRADDPLTLSTPSTPFKPSERNVPVGSDEVAQLVKRTTCPFPDDPTLVAVTPDLENAGWAMSPDKACVAGMYCPIACRSGMVMAQWQPGSVYSYPQSVNGGLYCDHSGVAQKPFPQSPFCVPGTAAVTAENQCSQPLSYCQTVLPGYEDMLIPTLVPAADSSVLAVPSSSYWCGTAAHYYVNPPGTTLDGCHWGSNTVANGNWSPYVAGANTVSGTGMTFVKVAWNPVWTAEPLLNSIPPAYGIAIECDGPGCLGLPCSIDPRQGMIGAITSNEAAVGAGGAAFCVVTVPPGGSARIVTFDASEFPSFRSQDSATPSSPAAGSPPSHSPSTPSTPSVTTDAASEASPTTLSSHSLPTNPEPSGPSSSSLAHDFSSTNYNSAGTETSSTYVSRSPSIIPEIFHQNDPSTVISAVSSTEPDLSNGLTAGPGATPDRSAVSSVTATLTGATPSSTTSDSSISEGEATLGRRHGSAAILGLLVAFCATAYLY